MFWPYYTVILFEIFQTIDTDIYAAIKGHLEITLLKGQRFNAISTSR